MVAVPSQEALVSSKANRKDSKGRPLWKGESERKSENRYSYAYTDTMGSRHYIYNKDLMELRKMEDKLHRDIQDGIGIYGSGKETINDTFDRYLETKYNLKMSTKSGYIYTYDHFVRNGFGKKKVKDVIYSDVLQFYKKLIEDDGLAVATVDSIHCLLHTAFQMAVRDQLIRLNPTDNAMAEISKLADEGEKKFALTPEQQKNLMSYLHSSPKYFHWWPIFTILLGTGCRIGEAVGIRWQDIDLENESINVNHSIGYYADYKTKKSAYHVDCPKTASGIRIIPMYSVVREAIDILKDEYDEYGPVTQEIEGYTDFIMRNRFGNIVNPQGMNKNIDRIIGSYNEDESRKAAREHRNPVYMPHFSCHNLRHTFITRLCEVETNLKVVMYIAGHHDIKTTMEIYAEATERRNKETVTTTDKDISYLFR